MFGRKLHDIKAYMLKNYQSNWRKTLLITGVQSQKFHIFYFFWLRFIKLFEKMKMPYHNGPFLMDTIIYLKAIAWLNDKWKCFTPYRQYFSYITAILSRWFMDTREIIEVREFSGISCIHVISFFPSSPKLKHTKKNPILT